MYFCWIGISIWSRPEESPCLLRGDKPFQRLKSTLEFQGYCRGNDLARQAKRLPASSRSLFHSGMPQWNKVEFPLFEVCKMLCWFSFMESCSNVLIEHTVGCLSNWRQERILFSLSYRTVYCTVSIHIMQYTVCLWVSLITEYYSPIVYRSIWCIGANEILRKIVTIKSLIVWKRNENPSNTGICTAAVCSYDTQSWRQEPPRQVGPRI